MDINYNSIVRLRHFDETRLSRLMLSHRFNERSAEVIRSFYRSISLQLRSQSKMHGFKLFI